MKITMLGTGSATGVPMVSAGWGKCDPLNPKNRRLRSSILIEHGETAVLVDTGPDLREQMLSAQIKRLDGVIYTHGHADHTHGIDEIREVNRAMRSSIPAWGPEDCLADLSRRFTYVFEGYENISAPETIIYKPWLVPHILKCPDPAPFTIGEISFIPIEQDHGGSLSLGFRFGDTAYSTDLIHMDEKAFSILEGVKTWIVGCVMERPHYTHANLETVLGWVERLKPDRTIITHMGIGFDYQVLKDQLPDGVVPGYDGMIIEA